MQNLIGIVSFGMAVAAGLVAIRSQQNNRRTASMIVAFIFITAFLMIYFSKGMSAWHPQLVQKSTCFISFAMAVTGGVASMLHDDRDRQFAAGVVGFASLVVSFCLLW